MDILKPELVWVNDRCYRKLPIRESANNPEPEDLYPIIPCNQESVPEELDNNVVQTTVEEFYATLFVPGILVSALHKKVIRPIEKSTRTEIKIPPKDRIPVDKHFEIIIVGKDTYSVKEVHERLTMLIDCARWKQPFTHFISLPMNFDVLKKSFLAFKDDVLNNCKEVRGLSDKLFQDPNKLHLTVVTLILLDDTDCEEAVAVLQKSKEKLQGILRGEQLIVAVKGIEYMNDDPADVHVLYAKVVDLNESDRLQVVCNKLLHVFEESRFTVTENESVKLHITLMNSSFRKTSENAAKVSFDATNILENYKDYDFGVVSLSDIHISIRYTRAKDGYYKSYSILTMPVLSDK